MQRRAVAYFLAPFHISQPGDVQRRGVWHTRSGECTALRGVNMCGVGELARVGVSLSIVIHGRVAARFVQVAAGVDAMGVTACSGRDVGAGTDVWFVQPACAACVRHEGPRRVMRSPARAALGFVKRWCVFHAFAKRGRTEELR